MPSKAAIIGTSAAVAVLLVGGGVAAAIALLSAANRADASPTPPGNPTSGKARP
ncbi:hypothetical protein [Amycolatopsis japonica]|uniref:hypothetical protein n=1 Tax=Amycolatopsis japonica TaxID=208439 RepID=UPI00381169EA